MSYPPQQHPPPPPGYGYPPPMNPMKNGLGTGSLILGIMSVLFFWVPIFGLLVWPTSITGMIMGMFGRGRATEGLASNKGVATSGIVTSVLGLIGVLIVTVLWSWGLMTSTAPATS